MKRRISDASRILLTGASSGIGRELALAFARRGARLLLLARSEALLQSLVDECAALGSAAHCIVGDVAEDATRSAAVESANMRWQGLDLLINNAGVSAHGPFVDGSEETLRRIMEVNFFAAVELTRSALPLLRQGDRPAVVNVGSILGHRGVPFNSEYSASKFALRGWSEAVRAEFAGLGVDVLLVSPGTVDTQFFAHLLERRIAMPWGATRGITPAEAARQTLVALEAGRHEIFPNWRGRALAWGNCIAPRIVDRMMRRYGRGADA